MEQFNKENTKLIYNEDWKANSKHKKSVVLKLNNNIMVNDIYNINLIALIYNLLMELSIPFNKITVNISNELKKDNFSTLSIMGNPDIVSLETFNYDYLLSQNDLQELINKSLLSNHSLILYGDNIPIDVTAVY